jgi:hypothetical protein
MSTVRTRALDTQELERRVEGMYEEVARHPDADFHFETGRALAERLGYARENLDRIPAPAIDSFAGVGQLLDPAELQPGDVVLDLRGGSPLRPASTTSTSARAISRNRPSRPSRSTASSRTA